MTERGRAHPFRRQHPIMLNRHRQRAQVILDKPIKTLGVHAVKVRLHAEVTVTVNLNIARTQDEAERQARGENVVTSQFEEDRLADEEAAKDMLEGGAGAFEGDLGRD